MSASTHNDDKGAWLSAGRAALGRCPSCGKGRLFRAYLKQVETCSACGERFGHIRADDGPAWLTILVVGHIIVGLALAVEPYTTWSSWVAVPVWSGLTIGMTLALLPSAKGIFIAALHRTGAPDSETG